MHIPNLQVRNWMELGLVRFLFAEVNQFGWTLSSMFSKVAEREIQERERAPVKCGHHLLPSKPSGGGGGGGEHQQKAELHPISGSSNDWYWFIMWARDYWAGAAATIRDYGRPKTTSLESWSFGKTISVNTSLLLAVVIWGLQKFVQFQHLFSFITLFNLWVHCFRGFFPEFKISGRNPEHDLFKWDDNLLGVCTSVMI